MKLKFEEWFNEIPESKKKLFPGRCEAPLEFIEECKKKGVVPEKFPEPCTNCWKVLIIIKKDH